VFDLLVVGGGINGTGIARDAAGRGLRVLLCEQDDLAQGTSSRSSRLIHGGLRYLEFGELRLVREALHERAILQRIAPHLVRPIQFVLPHVAGMRPVWILRLGLFLYDHLARRGALPGSRAVWLDAVDQGAALRAGHQRGFLYADCRTDDARLVVHNAIGARDRGAHILTRCQLLDAHARDGLWQAQLHDSRSGTTRTVRARALVNAAGPWVNCLAARLPPADSRPQVRLIKGSHLVVAKFWSGDHGYLLQHTDRRVIFVTPYEGDTAMIGTTDIAYAGDPAAVTVSPEEIAYLCDAVNRQMHCALGPADVRHAYAGVRSLADDDQQNLSAVTRDYVLDLRGAAGAQRGQPPLLTVLGGKITTFRRLSEHALELLRPSLPHMGPAWTAGTPLPGGDLGPGSLHGAQAAFVARAAFLPEAHARGLFDRHGSVADQMLAGITRREEMGRHFGAGLYEREVRHLIDQEWACTAEDVLWRRTKCGLHLTPDQIRDFQHWLDERTIT
jgi:glycerol-3-phosphate dehydrogenase